MKTKALILVTFILTGFINECMPIDKEKAVNSESVTVIYTSDLRQMAERWSEEFRSGESTITPTLEAFNVRNTEKKSDALYLFTDKELTQAPFNNYWKMVVGRSIVVPVIHKQNALFADISKQGIQLTRLQELLISPDGNTAEKTFNLTGYNIPVPVYVENDAVVQNCLYQITSLQTSNKQILETDQLLKKLNIDKNAVIFCQLSHITDKNGTLISDQLSILPIDKNNNGKLDAVENIYADMPSFYRGIWIGKYPKALYSNLYLASASKPDNDAQVSFTRWVLTTGQSHLGDQGYRQLVVNEVPSKLAKIQTTNPIPDITSPTPFKARYFIVFGIALLVLVAGIEFWIRSKRKRLTNEAVSAQKHANVFNASNLNIPGGLHYDKSHSWAFMEKDGQVRIGIDDFITHATGPLSSLILKSEGERVRKGEHMLTLTQEGKQLKICAPVSGLIQTINTSVVYDASRLSDDPFGKGWIYTIQPENWENEAPHLHSANLYKHWIINELIRFKDFIAQAVAGKDNAFQMVVMQDGGELVDNTLSKLDPEIWEEFQSQFL